MHSYEAHGIGRRIMKIKRFLVLIIDEDKQLTYRSICHLYRRLRT